MVKIAIISQNLKTASFIENRASSFKWISCNVYRSIDSFLEDKFEEFQIIIIGRKIVENYYMDDDGIDITEWFRLIAPKSQVMYVPSCSFKCRKKINNITQIIFKKSISLDSKII